jgi:hypothetical protein
LPRADVIASIETAWEQELLRPAAAAASEPMAQALSSSLANLERDRRPSLLLDDHGPLANLSTHHDIADTQLNDVTAA